ncbi:MAG: hypothetical protein ACLFOY_02200 [Desulfatibacillaceae bacterium]
MRRGNRRIAVMLAAILFLLTCAAPGASAAGIIVTRTEMSLTTTRHGLDVVLDVYNDGTDVARNVLPTITVFGREIPGPAWETLEPEHHETARFHVPYPDKAAGTWPVVLRTLYYDEGWRPFSAVHCAVFTVGEKTEPGLDAFMEIFSLPGRGTLDVLIQNLSGRDRKVSARLVVPREFSCDRPEATILAPADDMAEAAFFVMNAHATPSDVYPVFCVVEWDENGRHHTVLTQDSVVVDEPGKWFERTREVWAGLGAAAALCFFALRIADRRKDKEHAGGQSGD